MTRALKPCGTTAAYRRHLRAGEAPCDACRAANAAAKKSKVAAVQDRAAEVVKLAIVDAPPPAESTDELEKLRWNLRILEATMESGVPNGMAALSKQHAELVARIVKLESAAAPKESKLDELARRRAQRLAASQD